MSGYNEIFWYGERGIINALVVDIVCQNKETEFLRSILWASGQSPVWFSEITNSSFLVEHSFADFGNPDLIVTCRTSRDETHVILVEAKIAPYLASAISNSAGMKAKFNSRINGQLSLRHRLTWALSRWDGEPNDDLREPSELHAAYCRDVGGLNDKMRNPRHLAKKSVLSQIRKIGIQNLPLHNYHLVAITTDQLPFWQTVEDHNLLPLCLNAEGKSMWDEMCQRVGWTNYQRIAEFIPLGKATLNAIDSMVGPSDTRSIEHPGGDDMSSVPYLPTVNRELVPAATKAILERIELVAEGDFKFKVIRHPGSTSIELDRLVGIKLVPLDTGRIVLGLSPDLHPERWCPFELLYWRRIGIANKIQPFQCFELSDDPDEAVKQAKDVFAGVLERPAD